jgi:hypothetical protein
MLVLVCKPVAAVVTVTGTATASSAVAAAVVLTAAPATAAAVVAVLGSWWQLAVLQLAGLACLLMGPCHLALLRCSPCIMHSMGSASP